MKYFGDRLNKHNEVNRSRTADGPSLVNRIEKFNHTCWGYVHLKLEIFVGAKSVHDLNTRSKA